MNLLACLIKLLGQLWKEIPIRLYLLDFWSIEFRKLNRQQREHSSGQHNTGMRRKLWAQAFVRWGRFFGLLKNHWQKEDGSCSSAKTRNNASKSTSIAAHCPIATANLKVKNKKNMPHHSQENRCSINQTQASPLIPFLFFSLWCKSVATLSWPCKVEVD